MEVHIGFEEWRERSFLHAVDLLSFVEEKEFTDKERGEIALAIWDSGVDLVKRGALEKLFGKMAEDLEAQSRKDTLGACMIILNRLSKIATNRRARVNRSVRGTRRRRRRA